MNIQSLWIGERLSVMEKLSIQSFLACGHTFDLYAYQHIEGVPRGAQLRDANEIMPLDLDNFRYDDVPCAAAFASAFRYKLLGEKGGIWVDTDVVCLRPIYLDEDYCFPLTSGFLMLGRNAGFSVDNWFIKAPKGSDFIRYCYDAAMQRAGTSMPWGTLGPTLLTAAVQQFSLGRFARGPLFFPINWKRFRLFVNPTVEARLSWTIFHHYSVAIHLYRAMWNSGGLDIGGTYASKSIYEMLKARYLPAAVDAGNPD
jgi:glycosyl transferase-like sugar-binding protein